MHRLQETKLLKRKINSGQFLLCILAYISGLGIEFPFVNIFGNFTFVDLIICIYLSLFIKSLKLSIISIFPIIIATFVLFSLSYNILTRFSYHDIAFSGFPIMFRWVYYGLLICLYAKFCRTLDDLYLFLSCMLLGIITLVAYAWLGWIYKPTYFFGFPVLAYNEELNANTLGFYFASSIPIIFFLRRRAYLGLLSFLLIFVLVSVSCILPSPR